MKAKYICQCEKISEPEIVLRGYVIFDIACLALAILYSPLWLIPGGINYIYRHSTSKLRCPWCKQYTIYHLDSIEGAVLYEQAMLKQEKEEQSNSGE